MSVRQASALWLFATLAACTATAPAAQLPSAAPKASPSCAAGSGLVARLGQSPLAEQAALASDVIAVLTSSEPRELVLYELGEGRVRWRKPLDASARPQILSDIVVTVVADRVIGLDLASGAQRFSVALPKGLWLGAAQLGSLVVFTTTSPTLDPRTRESTLSAVDLSRGALRWTRSVRELLSRPRVSGAGVLALADHRELRVFDAADGGDIGCVSLGHDGLVDWLRPGAVGLLYGGTRAHGLGAPAAENALALPSIDAPSAFGISESDHLPVPGARSAHGRVGWYVALDTDEHGAPVARGDRMYFTFYRHLLAYRRDGSVAWARLLAHDVVRAQPCASGLVVVTENGETIGFEAASGAEILRRRINVAVASAAINVAVASAAINVAVASAAINAPLATAPPATLRADLSALALDPDTRLLPTRRLAIDALAALPDPDATLDLLQVVRAASAPQSLRDHVAERLTRRNTGLSHLAHALDTHYDFLDATTAPPLAAILPALVAQHHQPALPSIVDRLFDPATPTSELAACVSAIQRLGGDQAREPLARFLALYHADSALAAEPSALILAARALSTAPHPDTALLARLREPRTIPALRSVIEALLAQEPPGSPPTTGAVASSVGAPAAQAPAAAVQPTLQQSLASHAAELRACVAQELTRNPKLTEVRLGFVVQESGALHDVHIVPSSAPLIACLEPKLLSYRVAERAQRGPESYVIGVRQAAPTTAAAPATVPMFWALSERRSSGPAFIPKGDPWWKNQNPLFISMEPAVPAPAASASRERSAATTPEPSAAPKPAPAASPAPTTSAQDAWWLPTQ